MVTVKFNLNYDEVIFSTLFQYYILFLLLESISAQGRSRVDFTHEKCQEKTSENVLKMVNSSSYFVTPSEMDELKHLQNHYYHTMQHIGMYRREVPRTFDARKAWSNCRKIINYRRNQGFCSASWAVATASMISDRLCIESKGGRQVHISAEHIITCVPIKGRPACSGGTSWKALEFWKTQGVVTGGNHLKINKDDKYHRCQGCVPYSSRVIYKRDAPPCHKTCTNPEYPRKFREDKNLARIIYRVTSIEIQMQLEIMNRGPVVAFMHQYEDYIRYVSGIYKHVKGKRIGDHFVKVIGWGVESNVRYWLISNSFGREWGDDGMFKILRGVNACQIESNVVAGRTTAAPASYREIGASSYFHVRKSVSALACQISLFFSLLYNV